MNRSFKREGELEKEQEGSNKIEGESKRIISWNLGKENFQNCVCVLQVTGS